MGCDLCYSCKFSNWEPQLAQPHRANFLKLFMLTTLNIEESTHRVGWNATSTTTSLIRKLSKDDVLLEKEADLEVYVKIL